MPEITGRLSTALAERYKIDRRLGEGGMATVYLAEDLCFSPLRGYDVLTDGSFIAPVVEDLSLILDRATDIHVIRNFFEELKAKVGNE